MHPQPFKETFDTFFMKVYPEYMNISPSQRSLVKTFFYVGGLLFKNSAVDGGNDDASLEQNVKALADIQVHLRRYSRQLNRTAHPPIKGKLGDTFKTFLAKDVTPPLPKGKATLDCYNAYVAGIIAMLELLTESSNIEQDDIAITRFDIINNDLMSNTGIEAWHVPTWPMDE
tara:strand:- start:6821 stop:7336 length:516 start_codon:yes stop_codon:yes gene_type:complete